jgi:hypothetical protein
MRIIIFIISYKWTRKARARHNHKAPLNAQDGIPLPWSDTTSTLIPESSQTAHPPEQISNKPQADFPKLP